MTRIHRWILSSSLLLLLLLPTKLWAQTPPSQTSATSGPNATISISIDGKPVDLKTGAATTARQLDFVATLDPVSRRQYADLQDAVVKSAWISLVRDTKRVGSIYWKAGEPITKLAQQARPGDRYVIEFDLAARRKNGRTVPIANRPIYTIPLH